MSTTHAVTEKQRRSGVWSVRHSRARKPYGCAEGAHDAYGSRCLILPGERYWRFYGKMAEASRPFTVRICERHQQEWIERYGE